MPQMVKCLPTMWETGVWSPGWEDPLEKEMATHSSTLAWKIPWTEERGRLRYMGLRRVGHNWATSLHFIYSYVCVCVYTYRVYRLLYILCSATREATAMKVAPTSTPTSCFLECLFLRLSATIFSNFSIFFNVASMMNGKSFSQHPGSLWPYSSSQTVNNCCKPQVEITRCQDEIHFLVLQCTCICKESFLWFFWKTGHVLKSKWSS